METLAESCLRKLIAETSTFLIISKRAASHLHLGAGGDSATDLTPATPDVIAELLKKELQPRVEGYGLSIDRVEIQEVQLPPAIQTAVDEVWIASTLPTKSGHEAQALQNRLKVLVESLGQGNAAMVEMLDKMPKGMHLGGPQMLPTFLAQLGVPFLPTVPVAPAPAGVIPPASPSINSPGAPSGS